MVTKKTWAEFRETGLLLYINQVLHLFGWAIVFEIDESGDVKEVYPARVKFRGFDQDSISESYTKATKYLKENIDELDKEIQD